MKTIGGWLTTFVAFLVLLSLVTSAPMEIPEKSDATQSLEKRHEWTFVCFYNEKHTGIVNTDLSRLCLKSPYGYRWYDVLQTCIHRDIELTRLQ